MGSVRRFDTHVHLWRRGDGNDVRIRARVPELDADFGLDRLRPALDAAGIERIVLVSAVQNAREPAGLLEVARRHQPLVAGVVGWLDVSAADFADEAAALGADPLWLGIRLPIVLEEAANFAARPGLDRALERLAAMDALVQVLMTPDQIVHVAPVLERHPALRIVIDHAANPDLSRPLAPVWQEGMARLARLPNTFCKVSAFWLPGEDVPGDEAVRGHLSALLAAFGPRRLVAAGNWPVSSLAMGLGQVFARIEELSGMAPADYYDNAARLYRRAPVWS